MGLEAFLIPLSLNCIKATLKKEKWLLDDLFATHLKQFISDNLKTIKNGDLENANTNQTNIMKGNGSKISDMVKEC